MALVYGSVCSGIEAPTMAWHHAWLAACVLFSEIDASFRPPVLEHHHYPSVLNHGDMTAFKEWPDHDN
jgi:DNA (cytosine-5)-methyltransferase 1